MYLRIARSKLRKIKIILANANSKSLELFEMRFVEGFTPHNKDDTIEQCYFIMSTLL